MYTRIIKIKIKTIIIYLTAKRDGNKQGRETQVLRNVSPSEHKFPQLMSATSNLPHKKMYNRHSRSMIQDVLYK